MKWAPSLPVVILCLEVNFVWYCCSYTTFILSVPTVYPSLSFSLRPVSLYLKYLSCKQHIVWALVFGFFSPQSDNFCLLIGVFNLFKFHQIIDIVGFKSIYFFISPSVLLFLLSCVIFCGNQVIFSILFHPFLCWLLTSTSLCLFLGITMRMLNPWQSCWINIVLLHG